MIQGFPMHLLKVIQNQYKNIKIAVGIGGPKMKTIEEINCGVRKGFPLSPVPF
jgi:hypothetical protein